jgi:hypothetical protein
VLCRAADILRTLYRNPFKKRLDRKNKATAIGFFTKGKAEKTERTGREYKALQKKDKDAWKKESENNL